MRVLLAEQETNVRYGLRVLLEERTDLQVAGEAADVDELSSHVASACPDLVLLSWDLAGRKGAELISALRRVCPGLLVIVLSGRPEARQAALDAGANAFISKVEPPEQLLAAVEVSATAAARQVRKGNPQ
jgi:DNA-binding NarL/FixJ family response regulator